MTTLHQVYFSSSASMNDVPDHSIDLVVTSPPYPMIEMWDAAFGAQSPTITAALTDCNGSKAFELMHEVLDHVWRECARVVRAGGFVCVNVGDATRKLGDNFRLYPNHSRITSALELAGFQSLPLILWRKGTTAPNKFMGSGMLPSGAYVTLEHEYILIFRKGGKREFSSTSAETRRESAFFWEERNRWFSDIWDLGGVRQEMNAGAARSRSASFPLEVPFRLINMYSLQGDTVLDPFLGTGTTAAACLVAARNSIGYERSGDLQSVIAETMDRAGRSANEIISDRFRAHDRFVLDRTETRGTALRYASEVYGFPVMTRQEIQMRFYGIDQLVQEGPGRFAATHSVAMPESSVMADVRTSAASGNADHQLGFSFTS